LPKFSIITVVKNSHKTIQKTIDSISNQNFNNFEFIVVCHISDLKTRKILAQNKKYITHLILSNDKGIYEAMNIGIKKAKGNYITFLNSDDYFLNPNILRNLYNFIIKKNFPNILYGNIIIFNKNTILRKWYSGSFSLIKLFFGWHPPHPSMFIKKNLLNECGAFNVSYKIAGDYEFMVRLFAKFKIKPIYYNTFVIGMSSGGISSKNFKNIISSNIESVKSWKDNGYYFFFHIFFIKPLIKLRQFL